MNFKHFVFLAVIFFLSPYSLRAEQDREESVSIVKPTTVDVRGTFYSTPIGTSENDIVIASHNKHLYFFDTQGEMINSFRADGWIHATPTELSDSVIGIGCYDGYFYFFDNKGNYQDKIKPGGFIFTEPVEMGDHIAFGNNKGKVVFYNRKEGELSHVRAQRMVHGSPMVTSDSILVIGSNSGKLYFIDSDQELLHTFRTRGWIMHSKPYELADGNIIIGSYDKHLYCVDKDANLQWKFKTKGRIHSSPIQMANGNIVFGSMDGYIYVLSEQGKLVNRIKTGKRVVSSPSMVNDSIAVIGSYDEHLYFVDMLGNLVNTYHAQGRIFSSPIALPCGTVFCCTTKGRMSFLSPDFVQSSILQKGKDVFAENP